MTCIPTDAAEKPCLMCRDLTLCDIDAYICRECGMIHSFFEARNYGAFRMVEALHSSIRGSDDVVLGNPKATEIVLLGRKGLRSEKP